VGFTLVGSATQEIDGTADITLPGPPVEGDFVIVLEACDDNINGDGVQTSGYTDEYAPNQSNPGSRASYKIMDSSPDTVVSVKSGDNAPSAVVVQVWGGVDRITPLDVAKTTANGSSNQPNPPSITPISNNTLIVACGFLDDETDLGSVQSGYSNFASMATSEIGPTANNAVVLISSKLLATPAAENPGEFGGATDDWRAITLALRPYGHTVGASTGEATTSGELVAAGALVGASVGVGSVSGALSATAAMVGASVGAATVIGLLGMKAVSLGAAVIAGVARVVRKSNFSYLLGSHSSSISLGASHESTIVLTGRHDSTISLIGKTKGM